MGEYALSVIPDFGKMPAELTHAQLLSLSERMRSLLARRTALFTAGESSSVPIETAQALAEGLSLSLRAYLDESGQSDRLLLRGDLEELRARGERVLRRRAEQSRELWNTLCLAPHIENRSLCDTLRSIGGFWHLWEPRFFPQELPCDIDYQLIEPVPETLCGVDYLLEYLRRLYAETSLLSHFDSARAEALLQRTYRDYKELPVNLCEPVFDCALGLELLGSDILSIEMTAESLERLSELFEPMSESAGKAALSAAANTLCAKLGISDTLSLDYFTRHAMSLHPRIEASRCTGSLGGVFTPTAKD